MTIVFVCEDPVLNASILLLLYTDTPLLQLPSRSPDLSPIGHIWDHLGRRVGYPTSMNELESRLQQIWNEVSQDIIQNLYASMPGRIAACIRTRGTQHGIKSSVLLPFSLK
ncbi:transposable element Tcb1 transposase [Trichonephila clavipes]|nr:transposable element Tcb1 transposase [Trichonephila clavipes]